MHSTSTQVLTLKYMQMSTENIPMFRNGLTHHAPWFPLGSPLCTNGQPFSLGSFSNSSSNDQRFPFLAVISLSPRAVKHLPLLVFYIFMESHSTGGEHSHFYIEIPSVFCIREQRWQMLLWFARQQCVCVCVCGQFAGHTQYHTNLFTISLIYFFINNIFKLLWKSFRP